ncbi:DUF2892 domain-containing protein [uncultured Dokdonia sp.]|uniref:YgaP family membrane protein n=1 Tax=uncultured Dokdonia sp. TaxID=575653 RepID=UPI00262DC4B1|nr:DUF2892 domain-containing protein [uncultured Dokdonia sp.]
MKKNMGNLDRGLRIAAAVIIGILYATHVINGTLALVLGILALVFIATSFISFCPLYAPFKLSTYRAKK